MLLPRLHRHPIVVVVPHGPVLVDPTAVRLPKPTLEHWKPVFRDFLNSHRSATGDQPLVDGDCLWVPLSNLRDARDSDSIADFQVPDAHRRPYKFHTASGCRRTDVPPSAYGSKGPVLQERVAGIEPAHTLWQSARLPLHHTRSQLPYQIVPTFTFGFYSTAIF